MSYRGLEDEGKEAFRVLEEYSEEEKRRKAQPLGYDYYYGRRHSGHYYVAKPLPAGNIPQPKRQTAVIDCNEAAQKWQLAIREPCGDTTRACRLFR